MSDNGNNHHDEELSRIAVTDAEQSAFKGATIKLEDLEREDGILAQAASHIGKSNMGVLIKALTAIETDKEYRQILKFGNYKTREKARQAVKAIDECRRFGNEDGIRSILDDITAQSAGENMALLNAVFETLTHTTFTTNNTANRKGWKDNDKSNALS